MLSIKKIIAVAFFALLPMVSGAQEWHTDFAEAKALAEKEGKNIIVVFSGSDWCMPCIKLEKKVWDSEAFKGQASQWVLVKADFPKKKANQLPEAQQQQNAQLYEKYNKEGAFPLVVLMDKTGKVLGKTAYKDISPEEYIKHLHSLESK